MTMTMTMTTKAGWRVLAEVTVGAPDGHVLGHHFHDVEVTIGRRGIRYRVEVVELQGSSQGRGRDDVQSERRVVAIELDLDLAVRIASSRARQAGVAVEYLVQALSIAYARAMDGIADPDGV